MVTTAVAGALSKTAIACIEPASDMKLSPIPYVFEAPSVVTLIRPMMMLNCT
jgi:hypothetical protein